MQSVRIQITVASAEAVIIANCITSNQEQCIQQQKQLWASKCLANAIAVQLQMDSSAMYVDWLEKIIKIITSQKIDIG